VEEAEVAMSQMIRQIAVQGNRRRVTNCPIPSRLIRTFKRTFSRAAGT
jgi:hypothetical protein